MLKIIKDEWEFLKFKRLFELFYLGEGFFMYLFLKGKKILISYKLFVVIILIFRSIFFVI